MPTQSKQGGQVKSSGTTAYADTASGALPDTPIEENGPQDLNLDDNSTTENTRISNPLHANPDVLDGEVRPHPDTIVLLTTDAFGVLPKTRSAKSRITGFEDKDGKEKDAVLNASGLGAASGVTVSKAT